MKSTILKNRKNLTSKNVWKFLGVFLIIFSMFAVSACRSDDDPVDNDFFAGTYKGTISYNNGSEMISKDNGSVFVTKIASGTKYNFRFSDGIPDLNGVEFKKEGDNVLVMVGSTATAYIRIDSNTLKIAYTKDGKIWTANGTR
ncbi:hypothetical protein [Kaistella antarctica]|uniref:Lipocalin-like domain-containing protein n=1 Tax=Kaistella antarctica TaxID=266748 RepID=A0A448NSB8_9FLAO|nr:hypothetical protein [Kaistella antarctica]SEV80065.1 hypothetical protein SAMN05421765_0085 [Kaistella antarctica]VEI00015.1 Uncharacterised protein [Kaistella antarctica]